MKKCECGGEVNVQVCRSAAGFYIGQWCSHCGPYSRDSGYFASRAEAEEEMERQEARAAEIRQVWEAIWNDQYSEEDEPN